MNNKRATKRALLTSIMALVMCVVMLVGTTFAWFTDTASTGVNKIQAGNLDVALEMKDGDSWVSAEGKTLTFKTKDNRAADQILWEPGCTYELPQLRVVNKGNLALKYMIKITGIKGDAKLNEVIKWTITDSATDTDIVAAATGTSPAEYKLLKANDAHILTIKGEMDKNAGNEYQGLSIDGISITVYATQYTYEKDSINDQYDANAAYKGSQEFTSGTYTLNKGGVALNPNDVAVLVSGAGTDVTITGGYYDGGSGGNNRCVQVDTGAKVTIKDGTFTVGGDAKREGNSVILCNGGDIVIEGGFFQTDYNWKGFYYVLNQQNGNPGTITVKGGTFVNYDPSKGDDHLGGNFVPTGYSVITETKANGDVWYTVVSKSNSEGLKTVLANGGELTVSEEIRTNNSEDTVADRVIISKPTTLNLKAKIVSPDNMGNNNTNFCALIVDADTTINAGENGGIDTGTNGGYGINVRNGATLTINGGSYYGGGTTVQVQKGTLIINGGHFACEPYSNPVYGSKYLINCIDAAYKDGSAKIIIKGGTFVNFDPSDSASENPHGNFVADGYKVVSATQTNGDVWYTVVSK